MLNENVYKMLNSQINLEYYSSNLYLQMSSWFVNHGLEGCGQFMREHAEEERGHMMRLFDYVNETGAYAVIDQIDKPDSDFKTAKELFEATYEHEQLITKKINELAGTAFKENDFSTFNFLQWYVAEQHEEEQLFKGILDKIEIIGNDERALFFLDQEVAKLATGATPPSSMSSEE
jgi:ferritin